MRAIKNNYYVVVMAESITSEKDRRKCAQERAVLMTVSRESTRINIRVQGALILFNCKLHNVRPTNLIYYYYCYLSANIDKIMFTCSGKSSAGQTSLDSEINAKV